MAQRKSLAIGRGLLPALLLIVPLAGCAELNFWNDRALDVFQPFGLTSGVQLTAEGPLIVVVENLTQAAGHFESANVTITFTETTGGGGGLTTTVLAVPERDRPGNEAYRKTFVLNCKDIQSVTLDATVTRVRITETEEDGVFVPRQKIENGQPVTDPETIHFASDGGSVFSPTFEVGQIVQAETVQQGQIVIESDDETLPVCRTERDENGRLVREEVASVKVFTAFQRDLHFECGSVLVFAITEERDDIGAINLRDFGCDYLFAPLDTQTLRDATGQDVVLFSSGLSAEEQQAIDDGLLTKFATLGKNALTDAEKQMIDDFEARFSALPDQFILDRSRFLLHALFPYPEQYITVALSVPQFTDLDLLTPILIEQAAQVSADLASGIAVPAE